MSVSNNITYVGLDAHSKSITVAVILPGDSKSQEPFTIPYEGRALKRLAKKLLEMAPGEVYAVYEAGPCGYALQRTLTNLGIGCDVVAPSLIPVQPGKRVKTDRRDATKLASLLRADLLTVVHPPTEAEEALRDLTRAREDAKKDLMTARNRLSKMLLRYGLLYTEGKSKWTQRHYAWLKKICFEEQSAQRVFDNYLLAIEQVEDRVKTLEGYIEEMAKDEAYAEPVGWLRCLRGVDTVTAMTIVAELHDFRRFTDPTQLMAYLGLTPSEESSGTRTRRGGITKTGNSHVRRVLIEASWHYRQRPSVGAVLSKRRAGQPPQVIAIADRAQQRLYKKFYRLTVSGLKLPNVAITAVARELVGFIWAILNHQHLLETA